MTHQCDGEIAWCNTCEKRERAKYDNCGGDYPIHPVDARGDCVNCFQHIPTLALVTGVGQVMRRADET